MEITEIVKKARKVLPAPDWIMDLTDMSFIWVSPKGLKMIGRDSYTPGSVTARDIIDMPNQTPEQVNEKLMESLRKEKGTGEVNINTTIGKKIRIKYKFQILIIENTYYEVNKIISYAYEK